MRAIGHSQTRRASFMTASCERASTQNRTCTSVSPNEINANCQRSYSRVSRIFHRNIQGDSYRSQKDWVAARHSYVHVSKHAGQQPIQTRERHACRRKQAALLAPRWSAVGRQRVSRKDKGFHGKTWKYDFTSFYPSICSSDALFPIGRPEKAFLQVGTETELDLTLPAMYRVIIKNTYPLLVLRPIRPTLICRLHDCWVRLFSWQNALRLGLTTWHTGSRKNDSVAGSSIFGEYVHKVFALKKATGSKSGKFMLNVLTGMLVQKEKVHKSIRSDESRTIDITNMGVQQLIPERISYFSPNQQIFRRPDKARLGVFITAHGRHRVVKFLIDHGMIEKLVQVHTDGFHITEPLTD